MTPRQLLGHSPLFLAIGWLCTACHPSAPKGSTESHPQSSNAPSEGHDHDHDHDHEKDSGHGHDHDEESHGGATFKAGKGVLLVEHTRKSLGIEVADVTEQTIPIQISLMFQVYGEHHRHTVNPEDHTGCDVHGSAFVPEDAASMIRPGQRVEIRKPDSPLLGGTVLSVQRALALGESEVVIGVSNAVSQLHHGDFVPARIVMPRAQTVVAVPRSALLRTAEGWFVFVVNGDAFLRTAIQRGFETGEWIEIRDGLLSGDQVVTRAVQDLYLIELRATKGGGHSH